MDVELNRDAKQIVGDWLINLNAALRAKDARQIAALTWTIELGRSRRSAIASLSRDTYTASLNTHALTITINKAF